MHIYEITYGSVCIKGVSSLSLSPSLHLVGCRRESGNTLFYPGNCFLVERWTVTLPEFCFILLAPSPQVQEKIKQIWDEKLRVTEEEKGEGALPHVIQLSRRFKLSEKETLVMIYILNCQMREKRSSRLLRRLTGRYQTAMALISGYTLTTFPDCPGLTAVAYASFSGCHSIISRLCVPSFLDCVYPHLQTAVASFPGYPSIIP